jgi:hypothetical protein
MVICRGAVLAALPRRNSSGFSGGCQGGRIPTLHLSETWNGVAMSSSPWEQAGEGNEDVAAPFELRAVDSAVTLSPRKVTPEERGTPWAPCGARSNQNAWLSWLPHPRAFPKSRTTHSMASPTPLNTGTHARRGDTARIHLLCIHQSPKASRLLNDPHHLGKPVGIHWIHGFLFVHGMLFVEVVPVRLSRAAYSRPVVRLRNCSPRVGQPVPPSPSHCL